MFRLIRATAHSLPAQRTILVLGPMRGGTSMVAGMLRELGLFMGHRIQPKVHEDEEFAQAAHGSYAYIKELIEARNREFNVWGVKYPPLLHALPGLFNALRHPFLVVVLRHPDAVLLSAARRDKIDLAESMRRYARYLADLQCLLTWPCAIGAVHFEQGLEDPLRLADQLAGFTGLEPSREQLHNAALFVHYGDYRHTSLDKARHAV